MDDLEQTYTWRGLPYSGSRELTASEAEALRLRLRDFLRYRWAWNIVAMLCGLVVLLIIIPIPLVLMGVNALWLIGLSAVIFLGLGLASGVLEVIHPVNQIRRGLFS